MHALQEFLDAWSHQNVNVTDVTFNFHRQNYIWTFYRLEWRMDKSLIQIEHKSLFAHVRAALRSQKIGLICVLTSLTIVNCCLSFILKCNSVHRLGSCGSALYLLTVLSCILCVVIHLLRISILGHLADELAELCFADVSLLRSTFLVLIAVLRRVRLDGLVSHPTASGLGFRIAVILVTFNTLGRSWSSTWDNCRLLFILLVHLLGILAWLHRVLMLIILMNLRSTCSIHWRLSARLSRNLLRVFWSRCKLRL